MMTILRTKTFLDQIVENKSQRLIIRRQNRPVEFLRDQMQIAVLSGKTVPAADFAAELRQPKSLSIIAEIKKASPSKGLIAPDFRPAEQALAYAAAGVQAISVLTEEDNFCGCDQDLQAVHAAVPTPLLCKDFIIEEGQIYEARLLGASAVLLICAILDDDALAKFSALAKSLGMSALVEIHNLPELMRALAADASIIGINNRDLRTFQCELSTTERLAGLIPADRIIVSESGIATAHDLARVYRAGCQAVLIGETLMRSAGSLISVQKKIDELFQELPR